MSNDSAHDVAVTTVARWRYWIAATMLCASALTIAVRGTDDATKLTAAEELTTYEGGEHTQRTAIELTAPRRLISTEFNSPGAATSQGIRSSK